MSLDIDVHNPVTGEHLEMNWLRNPYGLEPWATGNYAYAMKSKPVEEQSLWYVINHWNYTNAEQVNRSLFLEVVKRYGDMLLALEVGFFWFDISAYMQFIRPHEQKFTWYNPLKKFGLPGEAIKGSLYDGPLMGIPMTYFIDPCFGLSVRPDAQVLAHYQDWYRQLLTFAEVLQHPESVFYCSN